MRVQSYSAFGNQPQFGLSWKRPAVLGTALAAAALAVAGCGGGGSTQATGLSEAQTPTEQLQEDIADLKRELAADIQVLRKGLGDSFYFTASSGDTYAIHGDLQFLESELRTLGCSEEGEVSSTSPNHDGFGETDSPALNAEGCDFLTDLYERVEAKAAE